MKLRYSSTVLAVLAAASLPAMAATIATVNGVAISSNRADALIAEQKAQGAPDSEQLRNAVKEELVRREILQQAAQKKGLDKSAEVQAQMDMARQAVLIRAYLQSFVQANPVSDADIRKEYDSIKARLGEKEYKARHILVDTEDQAKAIIAKLQAGEKFEDLAKESKDPGSKERGGDLGWANPGMFVKPFSDAMISLEKGKFTPQPVKSDFGYHIIKLDDVRALKTPSFEEVKPQIQQRLQQQKVEKHLLDLRSQAKVQ
ncbi:peptidylprolyl isomerase [Cognatazoarcus halotolerans]|uniref:peptidylprolyl isomerase n=1 Tax=Cognatazoarcus halotolerans TaxID=2686016 RepID=UPI00135697E5|nr:peptidylprolyl isomerase [Rhodocyclaceae bacterium]MCB1901703.1 peptidylprolyl isomerase [Rhodocyclaceae bacterium]MCP5308946.1 peptidylprolyl isomerase [Zoogloeaceae bacterium]